MDRAVGEAKGVRRLSRRCSDLRLLLTQKTRGRDVNRLLEEGAVERVGLIEDGQHLELATKQESLDRDLFARDEILDQHRATRTVGPAGGDDRRHPGEHGRKARGVIDLHHALAS